MSRRTLLILLLILGLAAFFRAYDLPNTPPGLYPDEAMNGNNALEALQTGQLKVYYPENNGREGLFINIQAAFLDFFNTNEPWVLRLPSAIFGTLTVLGIFFLAKELFFIHIGLFSSFLLATSVWHIIFSRIGFRAILAPFFLVWAVFFLLRAFHGNKATRYSLLAICSGALFGAGMYTYIAYRITPILILALILWFWWLDKENRKQVLLATYYMLLTTLLVALPLGLHYLQNPADFLGRTTQVSIFSSATPLQDFGVNILKTAGMFNFKGDGNSRHNYAGEPQLFWPVGIFFMVGIITGLIHLLKNPRENFSFAFLFFWLILTALPVVISNEGIPHALRAILMIPPVIILAAVGGIAAYNAVARYAPRLFLQSLATMVLIVLIAQSYFVYFELWGKSSDVLGAFMADYVSIGRAINKLPQETPKYVVVEAGGVDVRGIPMPAQTVMFITDSFTPEKQKEKNIHYLLPADRATIPANAKTFTIQ
ncbi:MAG: hypothetical protein FJY98_03670 [Candidatus Liptonbacteria bacterium]|nr:hypothetical protein [Candidatus Liptonbacteria bacterium]